VRLLLGYCHQQGIGVAPDANEAVRQYALSAAQGDVGGQFNLGGYELKFMLLVSFVTPFTS
jgi:TPR repeat protein